jgi:hypothetical protein
MRIKLILLGSILAGLLILKLITPEVYHGYDAGFYRAMSRELISDNPNTTTAPYSYRVLSPWLLHYIPLETETAFAIYNTILCAISAYLLFFLLIDTGGDNLEAGLGVFFFLSSWVNARFSIFYPVHIDGTYYFILILSFLSLIRKRDSFFFIALLLGSLTREYFLSLIPVYYFYRKEKGCFLDRAIFWNTIKLSIIPVLIFLLLRILIPRANQDFNYLEHAIYFSKMFFLYGRRIIHSYLNIYGVVIFILLLHLPSLISFLRKNLYLAIYILLSVFFLMIGGSDRCRINFINFPAILICLVAILKRHRNIYRNKLMVGYLVIAQLFLMRLFSPMTTENWRKIWWSNVSFCPETDFHHSLIRYGLAAAAFLLIYLGLTLRKKNIFSA